MKLVTFEAAGRTAPGAILPSGDIYDLAAASARAGSIMLSDMVTVIAGGKDVLARITDWLAAPRLECTIPAGEARLLAPLPRPTQIRDCANYEKHVRQAIASAMKLRADTTPNPAETLRRFREAGLFEIPQIWFEQPLYYKGNPMSVIGPDQEVVRPRRARFMDYELELGIVIGGPARDLTEANAMEAVFGYTIFNDFSARDLQSRETQFRLGPAKGKDFDTGNAIGPSIVTRDEIGDPESLAMIARVNGVEKVRTSSAGPQHSIAKTIAYISQDETLYPGELIGLGTVGDGCGYESLSFLEDGDVVELEIENIGVLRNRLVPSKSA
jgi:2-keto-4-pentenoate hydratase/2-oxohepta-3-ene-1,7-dioic acid hydratase in catechol pathway